MRPRPRKKKRLGQLLLERKRKKIDQLCGGIVGYFFEDSAHQIKNGLCRSLSFLLACRLVPLPDETEAALAALAAAVCFFCMASDFSRLAIGHSNYRKK